MPPTSSPETAEPLLRAAMAIVAFDAARALLWRGMLAVRTAYPRSTPGVFGSLGLNVTIQLVFAILIAGAARTFGDRRVSFVAWLAVVGHGLRLVLATIIGEEYAAGDLEALTILLDAAVAFASAAFIARTFDAPRARVLGVIYVVAAAIAALVNANAAMSLHVLSSSMSAALRMLASLTFIGLGLAAYQLIARLRYRSAG